jgi:3-hydroxymyristoyl/3-hydroxydecanoyl-(acyl carrier protein) dehydratase
LFKARKQEYMRYLPGECSFGENKELCASMRVDGDWPCFSGHFPGDPILPGIAQLDMVAECISSARDGQVSVTGLSRVKFRKIVRPGEQLDIYIAYSSQKDHYAFRITSADEDVCSGIMRCAQNITR